MFLINILLNNLRFFWSTERGLFFCVIKFILNFEVNKMDSKRKNELLEAYKNRHPEMNEKIVISANGYDHIDGRNAYESDIKRLTLGAPIQEENKKMQIAAQIWKNNKDGELVLTQELPIHQVFDLIIFLSRTLLYFKEAYRLPLLYDPEKTTIERIGVQGSVLPVEVCTDNKNINEDIKAFAQSLNDLGELIGERQRVLSRILEELECY